MTKYQNDMADDHDEGGSDESIDLFYWGLLFFFCWTVPCWCWGRTTASAVGRTKQKRRNGNCWLAWSSVEILKRQEATSAVHE